VVWVMLRLQALQPFAVGPGSTWGQPGVNLGSTCGRTEAHMGSTWGQPGVNLHHPYLWPEGISASHQHVLQVLPVDIPLVLGSDG